MNIQTQSLRESISEGLPSNQAWASAWDTTTAAEHFKVLPAGKYRAEASGGELGETRTGTPRYRFCLEILEGEHAGRRLWHDIYLTPRALAMAKRDLAELGKHRPEELSHPLRHALVEIHVVLRRDDDGTERNLVRAFKALPRGTAGDAPAVALPPASAAPVRPATSAPRAELFDDAFSFEGEGARHG